MNKSNINKKGRINDLISALWLMLDLRLSTHPLLQFRF
ncbi:hypothetical protein PFLA_a0209 [Pseudoalteromonas flavipulchra NCIMB 2033 = ATCC BAA-314]|nr:hypothetical protein [Pseudoalteromonas flavipulchra NCIMB 2033 = ATCC BAA-314]